MLNKKRYWSAASVMLFLSITAIAAGASFIKDPSGADIGTSTDILKHNLFSNFSLIGYALTYLYGMLGIILCSLSIKWHKQFSIFAQSYALSALMFCLGAFIFTGFSWIMILMACLSAISLWLSRRSYVQIKELGL